MVQVLHDTLRAEMARDSRVVVLGQDVGLKGGVFKVTDGLQAEFGPMRVLDTPISEIVIAGAAIGAAMMGLRPTQAGCCGRRSAMTTRWSSSSTRRSTGGSAR
jgi:pyruvate/2-oxoglutarate/acetoin dehydrogenase E1 component